MPEWLILSWALTFGWVPNQSSFGAPPMGAGQTEPNQRVFEQTLSVDADLFSHFRIGADVETRDRCENLAAWTPFQSRYRFRAGVHFGPVSLDLKHECIHPTISAAGDDRGILTDETEISVTIKGTMGR